MSAQECEAGTYPVTLTASTAITVESNFLVYSIFNAEDEMVFFGDINLTGEAQSFNDQSCLLPGCYFVQMDYGQTTAIIAQLGELSFSGEFVTDVEIVQEIEDVPWQLTFCVVEPETSCPSEIQAVATSNCHEFHFEIGSFVEGESVTWYFNGSDDGIVGGHFISHSFETEGEHSVCAFYTSPECPDGVELCTTVVVNCETETSCPEEISVNETANCHEFHFEIGSFVEGESVTWYFNGSDDGILGGHFISHSFETEGEHSVCAFYTSPDCPDGVELCTTVVVNCETETSCPDEIFVGETTNCHEFHFEIGSFIEGESVIWYFDGNEVGVVGGHFISHSFETEGEHTVCAYYSNPACPEGVMLCTSVIVSCSTDCYFEISAEQVEPGVYHFTANGWPETADVHWNFGDDTDLTGPWSVSHEFEPGTYIICAHTETEACGMQEDCITIEVGATVSCGLSAEVVQQSCELLILHATEAPEGIEIHWTADGVPVNVGSVSTFVLTPGSHSICAWYTSWDCGLVQWCETFIVEECSGDCNALFNTFYNMDVPGHLEFTNTSTYEGDVQWSWDFGNGVTSDEMNTDIWYTENGIYQVCLTLHTETCESTMCHSITISEFEIECTDNLVIFTGAAEYSIAGTDLVNVILESGDEQIFSVYSVFTTGGFSFGTGACIPDGCYELTINTEDPLIADVINATISLDGEEIDVLQFFEGTESASITFGVNQNCGDDISEAAYSGWSIYPNPVNAELRIQSTGTGTMTNIQLHDATGRMIYNTNPNSTSALIDVSSFATGFYIMKITDENSTSTRRIEITR